MAVAAGAIAVLLRAGQSGAQDMEPRAFSAVPVGTNFLIGGYAYSTGSASLDPSVPITNLQATINTALIGYSHAFDLLGRSASAAIVLPYLRGNISGDVEDQSTQVQRYGFGDLRMRLAMNLLGGPALTPAEFAARIPMTTVGASVTVTAPTGDYNPQHLVNIGTNRWTVRPELGVSVPLGRWFAEASAGASFFTDNEDFFNGHVRGQRPIYNIQLHAGYNFAPGLWLALDGTYYAGGRSSLDGSAKEDRQEATRYGATLSVPIVEGISVKFFGSSGLRASRGANFDTVGIALQYRWFDR